jgi:hypothetical protein
VARARIGAADPSHLTGATGHAIRGLALQVLEDARLELQASLAAATTRARRNERAGSTEFGPPLAARMVLCVPPAKQAALRGRLIRSLREVAREFKPYVSARGRTLAVTVVLAPTLAPSQARSIRTTSRARRRAGT